MKTKTLQLFIFIARLVLTIALLVFIFSIINPNSVWKVLVTANQNYTLIAGILVFPYLLLKSYKQKIIANDMLYKNSLSPKWIDKMLLIARPKEGKLKSRSVDFIDKFSEAWIVVFFVLLAGQILFAKSLFVLILLIAITIALFLYQFRKVNGSFILLIISFLTMLVFLLQAYLLLLSFYPADFNMILFVFPIVFLTNLVPVTIGSLGIREGVAIYLLSQFGIPATIAVSVSLLLFLFDTIIPGALGSLLFSFQPKSYAKKNKLQR